MRLTRGKCLGGAAAAALGGASVYELIDKLAEPSARPRATNLPREAPGTGGCIELQESAR